jgi:hypothetical protein
LLRRGGAAAVGCRRRGRGRAGRAAGTYAARGHHLWIDRARRVHLRTLDRAREELTQVHRARREPPERLGELLRREVAIVGLLLERLHDDVREAGGEALARHALVERDRRLRHVELDVLHRRLRVVRELAGQDLVQDRRERVDVAARVELLALRLLGRHELGRPEHHALLREHDAARAKLALGHLGETEVEHLREIPAAVLVGEEDVLGLQVAVNDAEAVGLVQGAADLHQDRDGSLVRERTLLADDLVQVLAVQELHHDVERAVLQLAVQEHLHGVLVRQVAHRPGFAAEAGRQVLPVRELGVKDLHRDEPVERRLRGSVDRAHAARADLLLDQELTVQHRTANVRIGGFLLGRRHTKPGLRAGDTRRVGYYEIP